MSENSEAPESTSAESEDDPRFEEIQEEVDEVRRRIPKNPGLGIPDPDVEPVMPPENRDEPGPPL